ncbi:MAG: sigma-70 family RNA polymerase sigma factor [Acidimicrobiia bacterium]|nr:sigma-70 family RNA polymerase sigma factor [Acidimicrobiia bacterium]
MNPFRRLHSVAPDDPPLDALTASMQRAGRGDEAALAEVYDALATTVFGLVRQVVRSPALAEEVTQEVFVEVWRLAPRYDAGRGSVRAWVTTIAHRRSVDAVRSTQSTRDRDQRDVDLRPADHDTVVEGVLDSIDRERVQRALTHLPAPQRQAIELAYYGGHTYREVAKLLECPEGTVKTRIRDGLIHLRDEMGVT